MLATLNRYPFEVDQQWVSYLPTALQKTVVAEMELRDYRRGETIYGLHSQVSEIYTLVDGSIKLTNATENGKDIAIITLPKGCTFGELSFIDSQPRQNIAVANTDCTLAVLKHKRYEELRTRHPELDRALLQFVAQRLRTLSDIHQDRNSLGLSQQLAKRLVTAFHYQAQNSSKMNPRILTTSQGELASTLGVSRQHVNKALKKWQSQSLLEISYRQIEILDIEGLEEAAKGNPISEK